jgi:hypothetical protein
MGKLPIESSIIQISLPIISGAVRNIEMGVGRLGDEETKETKETGRRGDGGLIVLPET